MVGSQTLRKFIRQCSRMIGERLQPISPPEPPAAKPMVFTLVTSSPVMSGLSRRSSMTHFAAWTRGQRSSARGTGQSQSTKGQKWRDRTYNSARALTCTLTPSFSDSPVDGAAGEITSAATSRRCKQWHQAPPLEALGTLTWRQLADMFVRIQLFEKPEQGSRLSDPDEVDAERLNLDQNRLKTVKAQRRASGWRKPKFI